MSISTLTVRRNAIPLPETNRWMTLRDGFKSSLRVEELLADRMYITLHHGPMHLWEGNVLLRNLETARRRRLDVSRQGNQTFSTYGDGYEALRALRRVTVGYLRVETRDLDRWGSTLHLLNETAWTLSDATAEERERYRAIALATAGAHALVRDPKKVEAKDRTARAAELKDRRGRFNPGRLSLYTWSAVGLLKQRRTVIHLITHRMDQRVYVLANYLDSVFDLRDSTETAVANLLRSIVFTQPCKAGMVELLAERLEGLARRLKGVHLRPFGPHCFRRTAKDLEEAAGVLRQGRRDVASELLMRSRNALRLMVYHRRLEEILLLLAGLLDGRSSSFAVPDFPSLREEVEDVQQQISAPGLDRGFKTQIVGRVVGHLQKVDELLASPSPRLLDVYGELKLAVAPF